MHVEHCNNRDSSLHDLYKRTLLLAVHLGPTIKIRLVLHHVPYMIYVLFSKRKKHRLALIKTKFDNIFLEFAA